MNRSWCGFAAAAAALLLAGCVSRPPMKPEGGNVPPEQYGIAPVLPRNADPDDYPQVPEAISGPAVMALINQAVAAREAGRPDQAVAALERALRIEPRNPFVWQGLAAAHLEQARPAQAESNALKSNSLARGNPHIERENWRLIAQSRQERGDAAGAEQARLRMEQLARLVGQ